MLLYRAFAAVWLLSVLPCDAMWVRDTVRLGPNGTAFLSKFCYDYDPTGLNVGSMFVELLSSVPQKGQVEIALFDDQASSYPDETANWGFHCNGERLDQTAIRTHIIQGAEMPGNPFSTFIFEKIRARWWYVALINCDMNEREVRYALHAVNIQRGWQRELSIDHCGMGVLVLFLAVYIILGLVQCLPWLAGQSHSMHPFRSMLLVSIVAATVGMALGLSDGMYVIHGGKRVVSLYLCSKAAKALSKLCLLAIVLLLSRGKCISEPLQRRDVIWVVLMLLPLMAVSAVLEVWGEYAESRNYTPGSLYHNWIGVSLVLTDIGLLALYLRNLRVSCRHELESDKRDFYMRWGSVFALAFVVLPASVVVSLLVSPWVRAAVMVWVGNCTHVLLLGLLVLGLWPDHTHAVLRGIDGVAAETFGMKTDLLGPGGRDDGIALADVLDDADAGAIVRQRSSPRHQARGKGKDMFARPLGENAS
eukprot:TRINITY_DN30456_c0_g5_i1.p1 TRINITY_DN30456_c0_g5~~TRINITY_DN30456_c0_g5_i1.p1  ORF type:complete len:476 (+),score=34.03 TRINITY_DN30456_c0_g5_i1:143-1570(+)